MPPINKKSVSRKTNTYINVREQRNARVRHARIISKRHGVPLIAIRQCRIVDTALHIISAVVVIVKRVKIAAAHAHALFRHPSNVAHSTDIYRRYEVGVGGVTMNESLLSHRGFIK